MPCANFLVHVMWVDPIGLSENWLPNWFNSIFSEKNTQNSISHAPHLVLEFFPNSPSLNPIYWGLSNNAKNMPKIPLAILVLDINEFWLRNDWTFDHFSTIGQNIMKPTHCTPPHQGIFNGIKSMARGIVVWEISMWQTNKINNQSFFHR